MVPILYYIPISPPCRAVLLLSKILEVELDLRVVNIMAGEQMKPEFIEMNPQHCIPTMKDDGLILWESRAIMTYLISAYGKDDTLYPKDVKVRALIDARLQFDLGTLNARMVDYFYPTMFMGAPLDEAKKAKVREALGWLDAMLKGREYAAAKHFTVADLCLTVTVSQIQAFGFEMISYKRIKQWLLRCKKFLQPYDYEAINESKAALLSETFNAKLNK